MSSQNPLMSNESLCIPDWRNGEEAPEGFRLVMVPLTDTEYQRFHKESFLTTTGTVWSLMRSDLGLPQAPHGIKRALQLQRDRASAGGEEKEISTSSEKGVKNP